jgi:hypothetical protein
MGIETPYEANKIVRQAYGELLDAVSDGDMGNTDKVYGILETHTEHHVSLRMDATEVSKAD